MGDEIKIGQTIYDVQSGYSGDAFKVYKHVVEKVTAKTVKAKAEHGWTSTFKKDEMGKVRNGRYVWHTDLVEAKKAVIQSLKNERESHAAKIAKLSDKIQAMIEDVEGGTQ